MPCSPLSDPHYITPLYHKAEAARIIRVPANTLRNWASPPSFPWADGRRDQRAIEVRGADSGQFSDGERVVVHHQGLITAAQAPTPRGPTIPFVGLAEAYVLASFRQAGVPMQRIRPAIRRLEAEMGLIQALASERLRTDGAEVLWDYGAAHRGSGGKGCGGRSGCRPEWATCL
jgi:hypothetical protein